MKTSKPTNNTCKKCGMPLELTQAENEYIGSLPKGTLGQGEHITCEPDNTASKSVETIQKLAPQKKEKEQSMGKNEELGLPFGEGMEKVAICFDVDGTLIDEDKLHTNTILLMDFFTKQDWKNVDVIVWSGGGADYARTMLKRITGQFADFDVKYHSKLEHQELRKKYDKIIAIDDIQDTRLGDINLIVRNK